MKIEQASNLDIQPETLTLLVKDEDTYVRTVAKQNKNYVAPAKRNTYDTLEQMLTR